MPSPHELFREGDLEAATQAQIERVKQQPGDADERIMLFVLFCFRGEYDRALIHLDTVVTLEGEAKGGASVYHALVSAEFERDQVFTGKGHPNVPPGDFPDVEARLRALSALRVGDRDGLARSLDAASEAGSDRAGKIDDREFDGLADYDDVLGNVLEVHAGGRYMWLPQVELVRVDISEPRSPLDLLWIPAEIERTNGETSNVHLPVLYPGTTAHSDNAVRLGRTTEWVEVGDDLFRGAGQKMFFGAAGEETFDRGLLQTRQIVFST